MNLLEIRAKINTELSLEDGIIFDKMIEARGRKFKAGDLGIATLDEFKKRLNQIQMTCCCRDHDGRIDLKNKEEVLKNKTKTLSAAVHDLKCCRDYEIPEWGELKSLNLEKLEAEKNGQFQQRDAINKNMTVLREAIRMKQVAFDGQVNAAEAEESCQQNIVADLEKSIEQKKIDISKIEVPFIFSSIGDSCSIEENI